MSRYPFAVLALDVDGTLVDGANVMSPAVREAVLRAREAGAHIVIATGRSMPGVYDTLRKLDITEGCAVASNGAVVFSYDGIEVPPGGYGVPEGGYELLHVETFDAREVVRRITERMPDALVAVEDLGTGFRVSREFPAGEINGRMVVQSVDDLVAEPVTRVIVRSAEHSADEFTEIVQDMGITGTNYFIGYSAWLDLAPLGVSKASGMQRVVDRLGLSPDDVLAIGDGHNDVELLQWAGRGVAMGQAPERLVLAADAQTDRVEEDGAAQEITRWLH